MKTARTRAPRRQPPSGWSSRDAGRRLGVRRGLRRVVVAAQVIGRVCAAQRVAAVTSRRHADFWASTPPWETPRGPSREPRLPDVDPVLAVRASGTSRRRRRLHSRAARNSFQDSTTERCAEEPSAVLPCPCLAEGAALGARRRAAARGSAAGIPARLLRARRAFMRRPWGSR